MSNYHATDGDGRNFKSKKALREALAANQVVRMTDTSAFSNKGTVEPDALSPIDVIVGPDPYNDRRWFANIRKGKVV
jgi:hypothetical protein